MKTKIIRVIIEAPGNDFPVKFMQHNSENGRNQYDLHIPENTNIITIKHDGKPSDAVYTLNLELTYTK